MNNLFQKLLERLLNYSVSEMKNVQDEPNEAVNNYDFC